MIGMMVNLNDNSKRVRVRVRAPRFFASDGISPLAMVVPYRVTSLCTHKIGSDFWMQWYCHPKPLICAPNSSSSRISSFLDI